MSLDEIIKTLALAKPFSTLDHEQLKLIGFVSEHVHLDKNKVLVGEGEVAKGAYILVEGELRATHNDSDHIQRVAAPGTAIAELALLVEEPRPASISATKDSQLLFVPRQHFMRLLDNYPDLAAKIAAQIKDAMGGYVGELERVKF